MSQEIDNTTTGLSDRGFISDQLGTTVDYAYRHSRFYRELFDETDVTPGDIKSPADMAELPVVDAEDVLENQPPATETHRFRNPNATVRRPFHTSGTTGQPKVIFKSFDEVDRIFEDVRRGFEHFGVTTDDVVANYCPFVGLNISCFGSEGGFERLGCTTIPIANTPYPPDREADLLSRYRPTVLHGLASHIDAKGSRLRAEGYDPSEFGVELITVVGDPVTECRKQHLREVFDARVVEYVGCTEAGAFAYECPESGRLHVLHDSVYVEVVDEEGNPVPEGERGRLAVTNLLEPGDESAMPLVRYAIGDVTRAYADDGSCGCDISGGVTIDPPRRRGQEFVAGAINLTPQVFEREIYAHSTLRSIVREYQVRVDYDEETGQDVVTLLIKSADRSSVGEVVDEVSPPSTEGADPESIGSELGRQLLETNSHLRDTIEMGSTRLGIRIVDDLDVGPGKPRRLDDRREGPYG
ncbi:phenylacetate--CoA ligase family protein [Saliphagus sp. GCM10025334]